MTERYTLHQNGNYHTVIDEKENVPLITIEFKENEFPVYACFHRIIDLLNEQEKKIQRCELAYNQLSSYVDANFDEYMTQKILNERIQELEKELNAFKPVVFQDMRNGTILLYKKEYGD